MAVQQLGKGKGKVATEEPDWEQSREDCEERLRRQRIEWELQVQEQKDRNNQKIQWDRMKKEYRANKRRVKGRRWFSFFSVWFFMGLASIAVGVGIDAFWHPPEGTLAGAISHVLPGIFTTFGIALMMGAIFDFAKNSEHFIALVTDILTDVILSKTFLTTLTDKSKEDALSMILRPSNKQIEQYPNINALFKKRVKEFSTMFDINFKTNVTLEVKAYKRPDEKSGTQRLYCQTTLTQTIYQIRDEFEPMRVYFEKEGSKAESIIILPPEGTAVEVNPRVEHMDSCGIKYAVYIYEIPKKLYKYDHLVVKRVVEEPGFDHWINYYWQSVTPYEGVSFCLECENGLTIKDHMVFDNRGAYHVTRQADGRRIEITSSQWLNADTGFSVTISDTPLKKDLRVEEEMEPNMDGDTNETEDNFSLPLEQQREAIK